MAYTVDILNAKKVADNGLLSKIQIGGKVYEIKDLIAREKIGDLSKGLDAIAADLAANYVKYTGIFADDKAVKDAIDVKADKSYVDAQIGLIKQFKVEVIKTGNLPTPSADTMYTLYLKLANDGNGNDYYDEYITIESVRNTGDTVYEWELIGTTRIDLSDYVTNAQLEEALANSGFITLGDFAAFAEGFEARFAELGALAHKDSATGTVAGQTISGVKATGTTAGSIAVALEATEKEVASTGKYTPAGTVSGTATTAGSIEVTLNHEGVAATLSKGDYTPAGTVSADFSHASADAELVKGTHTPEGSVSVALSGATFNAITGVGTQASFQEGAFTAATLDKEDVTANYATEGLVGSVNDDECLIFSAAGIAAITATKVNAFDGGKKEADSFTANSLPTMAENTVGVQSATFTGTAHETITGVKYDKAALNGITFAGTKAEGALVTGVTYDKAAIGTQKFTGETVDIAATFAGAEGDINVAGKANDYAVKTAEFTGAAVELAVGDIVVAAKDVTVQ